jgi:CubicO group peptidase (beta-lactamase class C family)
MRPMRAFLLVLAACSAAPRPPVKPTVDVDPVGTHKAAIAAQIQPLVDHEVVASVVVGIYDAGKTEIYGFGKGPGGAPPNGHTLFEIGSITKVYTSLLFADAIQRKEVALDTPVSELLPPGITMPTRDNVAVTLAHLALHVSGLPRLPRLVAANAADPNPYGKYDENALYQDLIHTQLEHKPGDQVVYSNFGAGLLGFVLGRKLGTGYAKALETRILSPLGLHETYVTVPAAAAARRAQGTNDDLAPVPAWTFDALAGAGAIVSSAHDQLVLLDNELDAAAGSKQGMHAAMRLTQEPQLQNSVGDNEGLGWQIDAVGRYWHNGGTGGYHSFIGFDPKTRRGIVVLASTSVTLVDHLGEDLYKVLAGDAIKPPLFPTAEQLQPLVGTYELSGHKLTVTANGERLYLDGEGTKVRLVPYSDHEFWIEGLQSAAAFERADGKVARLVFLVGGNTMAAARVE